jgi:hypothetical protein
LGLRKFQADGFLLTRVYVELCRVLLVCISSRNNSEPKQIWALVSVTASKRSDG